ncbi:hypothetical protein EPO34_02450 [Patescibacteria group bacterium]|nr:MAG: hypothetical protein EPO34_02450 [Patescibacteria group bacterium]
MSRRRKLLILIALLVAILLLILWWLLRSAPAVPPAQPVVVPSPEVPAAAPAALSPTQEARVTQSGAETVAKVFAERYGSFSSEAAFGNLRDVIPLATPAFGAQLEALADAGVPPTEYYGVTTRVVALTADLMDPSTSSGQATTMRFSVSTQRQEAKGSPQDLSVKYQDLEVTMEKVGGKWLVASATWK